ncbi:hypothetical protein BHM03_00000478 [Ensete ventricosum]|nr:hypothetical protein BHM03_00000478 [Ensete ventricosum]
MWSRSGTRPRAFSLRASSSSRPLSRAPLTVSLIRPSISMMTNRLSLDGEGWLERIRAEGGQRPSDVPPRPTPKLPTRVTGFDRQGEEEEEEEEESRSREKMFKLHRHRSDRFGEKVEFKLSNLQAIKVLLMIGKSWKDTTSHLEDHSNNDDLDSKSDGSDNLFNRNLGSSSSNHLANTSYPEEPGNRFSLLLVVFTFVAYSQVHVFLQETCFSASGSHRSSDSGDSFGRTAFSPKNSLNGGQYIGRLDSSGSQISATYSAGPGDELLRSNQSSFNSRASGSSLHTNHWQDITARTSNNGLATPSLRPTGSSKDLVEAAEEIDELHDEVKMWERHSRQLKLDLEILKKEISEKSKHQADLDRQLSAAQNERDSLKQEVKHLKAALEESMSNRTDVSNVKNEDMVRVQKELVDELNFQKDSNVNLTQQLKKTQESNIELVAIVQELEEITEKQKLELANLSQQNHVDKHEGHRSQKSFDNEAEWERKLALKEEEIAILEEKLSNIANNKQQKKMSNEPNPDLIREVEVLKSKVNELERDCAELTDENLDLIFKLKELSKDVKKGNHTHGSRSTEFHDHISSNNSGYENGLLISQIHEFEDELIKQEAMCGPLSSKLKDLEKVSADLERELQHYKDEASDLEIRLHQRHRKLEEKDLELYNLQQNIRSSLETDLEGFNAFAMKGFEEVESFGCSDMQNVLSEMDKQICLALTQARSLQSNDSSDADKACGSDMDLTFPGVDRINQKNQIECITKSLHELNTLLRENAVRCNPVSRGASSGLNQRSSNDTEAPGQLKDESSTAQEPEGAEKETKGKGNIEDEFQSTLLLKEKEIDRLEHSNKELADLLSSLQKEKCQLEEDLASLRQENIDNSKYLQDMEHELLVLTGSVESHVSVNKTLERKSVELESCNKELELHVSELEQENVKLSERISGLEAQLRYLTDEKESNRLELEGTRSLAADLKDEVEQQKAEMEMQKAELKQKLQETQKRLSVALEESDYSSRSNSKLQATIESLIEECSSLQKLNGDLKKQKLEFHERITHLEIELDESKKKNFDCCKQVDLLEIKLSLLQKDIALKEKSLLSQLEHIFQDHKEHEERIEKAHSLLHKIELEKTVEVENLKKEMSNLTAQKSSNHDEREKLASDAVNEASVLCSDKVKLECSLQEVNSKVKLYETDLQTLRQESKNKIQGLVDLLNASKQSEEMLMADIEHIQRTMDSVKSSEEKHRKMVNDLELKLKSSDYEKQQIMEESTRLKLQLQKLLELQNSVLDLKGSLDEADFERRKLEELLKSLSEEYEELKAEKVSLTEKVSNMQKALCNSEDDRRSRIVLQEKLLRLESDLSIKEASYAQEAEFKNELNRIKRTNSEYQRKVQSLEQENLELLEKVQAMEKDLVLRKTSHQDEKVSSEVSVQYLIVFIGTFYNNIHICFKLKEL